MVKIPTDTPERVYQNLLARDRAALGQKLHELSRLFLDVYDQFVNEGFNHEDAYKATSLIFPKGGPQSEPLPL